MGNNAASKILTSVVIILLTAFVAVALVATFIQIRYGFNMDYAESVTVANAVCLWQGKGLYRDISVPPYLMALYTPLYYLLLAPFSPEFSRILLTGRIISFACFLAIAAMVFSAVRRRVGGVAIPAISCGFLLSSYVFLDDGMLAHVNLLGICLSVLGVWILSERNNKTLAFIAFLLAVYTKQSLIAGVCAASIWMGITERPARGLLFFCLFCLLSGLILFIINIATGGQFLLHVVKYNVNPIIPKFGFFAYAAFFRRYIVLIIIALLGLSWRKPTLWQIYFVVGLLWGVTAAKEGARPIYFADALVGLVVSSGFALGRLRSYSGKGYGVILALIIAQIALSLPKCQRRTQERWRLLHVEKELRGLSALVRSADGPVLTENADLSLLNGKEYIYQGPEPRVKWEEGFSFYKPAAILKDIQERRFSLIAEYYIYRRDSEIMKLIGDNYYKIDRKYPSPLWRCSYTVWLPLREEG